MGVKGRLERRWEPDKQGLVGDKGGPGELFAVDSDVIGFNWLSLENGWSKAGSKETRGDQSWSVFMPEIVMAQKYSCQI